MKPDDLARYRRRRELTQRELGAILGVSQGTISKWEMGEHRIPPSIVMLLQHIAERRPRVTERSR